MRLLLAAAVLMIAAPFVRAGDAPVAPFRAQYEVWRNGDKAGVARVELAADGDGWTFTTHTKGTEGLAGFAGLEVDERTRFRWRDGRPEIVEYAYRQDAMFGKRRRSLAVDAAAGTIASTDKDERYTLAFAPNTMDRHVTVLALAADLASERRDFAYTVADRRDVTTHRYRDAGSEVVKVPAGAFECRKLERVREKPGRTTTSWHAKEYGWLPVRMLQKEPEGDTVETRLVKLER
ncbi:MAG TPA: DUF3108 domain-containing protein [Xanthomonadales bacterium]|nr:DUF3108 domain-containing protein [Xanthomonadales bacterium]